jgi:hypothetical protein
MLIYFLSSVTELAKDQRKKGAIPRFVDFYLLTPEAVVSEAKKIYDDVTVQTYLLYLVYVSNISVLVAHQEPAARRHWKSAIIVVRRRMRQT